MRLEVAAKPDTDGGAMNDNDPPRNPPAPPADDATPLPPAPPPVKKNRRRLLLMIVGGVAGFLILLVLLLPTIAGTGMVRSIVVGKINDRLNGKLEIADWSFGWTSGARIDGVKLTDADGRQLLQLSHVDAPISLIAAMRGKYDFGKVVVDGLDFNARREADGRLNFSDLANAPSQTRPAPAAPSGPSPSSPAPASKPPASNASSAPTKLPSITGEFVLTNCRGTIDDVQNQSTFHLTSLEADLKIPDINQPIEDSLDAVVDNGRGQTGKLSAKGTTLLVKNNVLLTDPAQILREGTIQQNITLTGFDLASVMPLLPPNGGINQLAGTTGLTIGLSVAPGSDAAVNAILSMSNLSVGGTALKGDTFNARTLELSAQQIGIALHTDATGANTVRIVTNSSPVSANLVQDGGYKSSFTLSANVSSDSLGRLAKGMTPGDTGTIQAGANIDFAHLAASMPHLSDLQPGLQLTSGNLAETFKVDLTPDKSTISQSLKVTDIAGRNSRTQTDIALQPIELTAGASQLGGGWLPGLRDLKLNLASGFATATASATSVDDLTAQLHATLQDVQRELSQIFDFGDKKMQGDLDVSINSQGNLFSAAPSSGASRAGKFDVHGTLKGLSLSGGKAKPVDEALIQFAATGALHGSDIQAIDQINGLDVTAQIGDAQNPTLDSRFTGDFTLDGSGPMVRTAVVQKFNLDLALAQQQLGGLIPALDNVHISAGAIIIGGFAKANGQTAHGLFQAYVQNVDMQRLAPADQTPAAVLTGYTLHAVVDGTLSAGADGSSLALNKLEVTDNQNLIGVEKADAKVMFTAGSGPAAKPVGPTEMLQQAEATVSLPTLSKLSDLLSALSPPPKATSGAVPSQGLVNAGSATLTLAAGQKGGQLVLTPHLSVSPDFALNSSKGVQPVGPVEFVADLALAASPDGKLIDQIDISRCGLDVAGGSALHLAIAGSVSSLSDQRVLHDMSADVTYDAAQLWKILLPTLSSSTQDQFKDAVVSGKYTKHFVVTGSYPAGVPSNVAMKNLSASGGLTLGQFKGHGIDLQNLDVPVSLTDGKFLIVDAPPATMNGGQLSLAGIAVDLTDPHTTLSMNPNSAVMKNVGLNPTLADLLGKDVGNILFVGTSDSTGQLNVTVVKCNDVPLDDTLKKNVPSNIGQAEIVVTIPDLTIGGGSLGDTFGKLGPALQGIGLGGGNQGNTLGTVKGSVKNYTITLAHGSTTHDMTITLGDGNRSLHLAGGVDLLTEKLKNMTLTLPLSLFKGNDADLPNGLNIVFKGTVSSPKPDIGSAVKKSLLGNGKPQDILNNIFGGKKKDSD
jgi:hypothetical protein